ncbi:MAG: T9SS type A sorting domain-containing protein [Candidatus Desulfofervidus auxilii]|nr:T9SS type A sorting domain-containing protein [Candidatus Desulfofervidus auxilii]
MTDSSNPQIIWGDTAIGFVYGIDITGWSNYVAAVGPAEYVPVRGGCLYIYDVSDPYNIHRIYTFEGDSTVPGFYAVDIIESESLLVTASPLTPGWSFDISNPSNPVRVGKGALGDYSLFVKPGYFYGADGDALVIRGYEWINVKEKSENKVKYPVFDFVNYKDKIKIIYSFPQKSSFEIRLIDASGKIIKVLKKGFSDKGELFIPLKDYTSGTYFVELIYGNKSLRRKINILK